MARLVEDRQGHIIEFYLEGRITAADLTDADTAQTLAVTGWPANSFKRFARIMPTEEFEDSVGMMLTNLTVSIGDADVDGLMTAIDLAADQSPTLATWQGALGAEANDGALEAAYAPVITVTSTAANLDDVDEGAFHYRIYGYRIDEDGD